jgi:hypothetical protein
MHDEIINKQLLAEMRIAASRDVIGSLVDLTLEGSRRIVTTKQGVRIGAIEPRSLGQYWAVLFESSTTLAKSRREPIAERLGTYGTIEDAATAIITSSLCRYGESISL